MALMNDAAYLAWLKAYIASHKKTTETFDDTKVLSALEEVEQWIKNYCRIPRVPNALKYVWANLALDLLRTLYPSESGGSSQAADPVVTGIVKEITTGDTTVRLDADSDTKAGYTHAPQMDDLLYKYKDTLQRFRMYQ